GRPAVVSWEAAPAVAGDYVERALQHVQTISPALGLRGAQAPEFVADPHVQQTSSGARAVNLQQRYKGIPIFQAAVAVRFAPDGAIDDTVGGAISAGLDAAVTPRLLAPEAVVSAARQVGEACPA